MATYHFPVLKSHPVIFRGRRFLAFEVSKEHPFDGVEEDSNFVIWDGLYDAALLHGRKDKDGTYRGVLPFHPTGEEVDEAKSFEAVFMNAKNAQIQFFKDTGTW